MSRLSAVLILTSHHYAQRLIKASVQQSPDTAVLIIQHPNELLEFGTEFLAKARLISFGSRFYVKRDVLDLIGFKAYNFHPGPANFPGWAPFNFALYHEAADYGTTLHEMTADIDSGDIIGEKTFKIPNGCDVFHLMDLTTEAMYSLYEDMAKEIAEYQEPLPAISQTWTGHIWTKKDFETMCHIPLEIDEKELKKRLDAFGSSDGVHLPYLIKDGIKYIIAEPEDNPNRDSHYLHGQRFIKID